MAPFLRIVGVVEVGPGLVKFGTGKDFLMRETTPFNEKKTEVSRRETVNCAVRMIQTNVSLFQSVHLLSAIEMS